MKYEFEYMNQIADLQEKAYETNKENLHILANKIAENMMNDHIIYVFGTGHSAMLGMELFSRAGGLANIQAMLDPDTLTVYGSVRSGMVERLPGLADIIFSQYPITKGDMILINSNSGRNSLPVEMAQRCQKEGIYTVAFTSLDESTKTTSRANCGKKLYELSDLVIDNCAPFNDTCVSIDKYQTGPTSSVITFFLINAAISEAIKIMVDKGFKPYVFLSQNVDGSQEENYRSYLKYHDRIKNL